MGATAPTSCWFATRRWIICFTCTSAPRGRGTTAPTATRRSGRTRRRAKQRCVALPHLVQCNDTGPLSMPPCALFLRFNDFLQDTGYSSCTACGVFDHASCATCAPAAPPPPPPPMPLTINAPHPPCRPADPQEGDAAAGDPRAAGHGGQEEEQRRHFGRARQPR